MKYYNGELTNEGNKNLAEYCKEKLSKKVLEICTPEEYAKGLESEYDFSEGPEIDHSVEIPSHDAWDKNPHSYSIPVDEIKWEVEEDED